MGKIVSVQCTCPDPSLLWLQENSNKPHTYAKMRHHIYNNPE